MSGMITDLTNMNGAASIDRTADLVEIVDLSANTSYKATPNFILGFTGGNPVSTSDTQLLTNKTLDNTNTVTLKDTLFTLQDDGDTSKQAKFQLSGITTATTRTYTLPNASSTLADTSTTQTFTNKTHTSPTINGGTIDNSTVTVDAVAGHTSSTTGTIYGISVTASKISGSVLTNTTIPYTALSTDSTWALTSYTPTWTNRVVTTDTNASSYLQIGKMVIVYISVTFGASSTMGSNPFFTLPVTSKTLGAETTLGVISCYDSSATSSYQGAITWKSTTTANLRAPASSGAGILNGGATASAPFAWAVGDIIEGYFMYEAA